MNNSACFVGGKVFPKKSKLYDFCRYKQASTIYMEMRQELAIGNSGGWGGGGIQTESFLAKSK